MTEPNMYLAACIRSLNDYKKVRAKLPKTANSNESCGPLSLSDSSLHTNIKTLKSHITGKTFSGFDVNIGSLDVSKGNALLKRCCTCGGDGTTFKAKNAERVRFESVLNKWLALAEKWVGDGCPDLEGDVESSEPARFKDLRGKGLKTKFLR